MFEGGGKKDMDSYHVVRNPDGGWKVKRVGSVRISSKETTQREAEIDAKRFADHSGGGEVRIHGRDGKIRDSDTVPPGHDPNPPRDIKH